MMRHCVLLVLLAIPLTPVATAQAPAPPAVMVAMKLDLVAWGDTIEGLSIHSGGKEVPVTARGFEYSKEVSYNGENILEISKVSGTGRGNPKAPAPAKAQNQPDGSAKPLSELEKRRVKNPNLVALACLPPGSVRVTVLLAPAANGTYKTHVIDDDPGKLPVGRLRIHNFSQVPTRIRCNRQQTAELAPDKSTVVVPHEQVVIYELAYQNGGKWRMQENNLIRVAATEQVQMIILRSDAHYFTSVTGSRGGFLQSVILRRAPK